MDECEICGGPLNLLGCLGPLYHYRCRNCGAQFHSETPPPEEETPGDDQP